MLEVWLPVVGYEGLYEVSSRGRVRSLHPPRGSGMMRAFFDRKGYPKLNLVKDKIKKQRKVHQIVCEAFHGPQPFNHEVGHRNGVRSDASSANLRWVTRSENNKDRVLHGNQPPQMRPRSGEQHPMAKYSDNTVDAIKNDAAQGMGARRLNKKYGISKSHAGSIVRGQYRNAAGTPDPKASHA